MNTYVDTANNETMYIFSVDGLPCEASYTSLQTQEGIACGLGWMGWRKLSPMQCAEILAGGERV